MKVTRRGLLGVVAGASGATLLVRSNLGRADQAHAEAPPQYKEAIVPTICQQCPGGCGLLARVVDGALVGVSGNPLHPINRGGACAKAFGGLQLQSSGRRLAGPLVKDGARGKLKPAGWDEALRLVAERLADLRERGLAHTVAIVGGQYRGTRDLLWRRFAQAYGTPNYVRARCMAPERPALAHQLMHGAKAPFAYDLPEARLVVSFGAGLLEAWQNPVFAARALARRRGDDRPRAKLVQVDPHRSPTAIHADRWIPIRPGTDGVLALGLCNALIRESLYDRAFVEENTSGFEDWEGPDGGTRLGFKSLVLRDYGLLAVSSATGVPADRILGLARELGTTRPALAIGERGAAYGPDDLRTRMAIHALNALLGAIGAKGGVLPQAELPLAQLPEVAMDERAKASLLQPRLDGAGSGEHLLAHDAFEALPGRILGGTPYPANALFLFQTNPLASHPAKRQLEQALEKVPLVVSFTPFKDETAAHADVVLPDCTPFERWQDDSVTHLAGFGCYSLSRPAISPRGDSRNAADVLLQLASMLGGSVAQALPWKAFDEVLRAVARGLYDAHRGYVVDAPPQESLRATLERQGYWSADFDDFDAFFDALAARGAWWDPSALPPGRRASFATKSGKFEFCSAELERILEANPASMALSGAGLSPGLPAVSLAPAPGPDAFPLRLSTYRLATRACGGAQKDEPWLLEQPAAHVGATWEPWVEIHPETASALGIRSGDAVVVESPKGAITLQAKLYAGTVPDVVHVPLFGAGPSPNELIEPELDRVHGFGLLGTTHVRVRRA